MAHPNKEEHGDDNRRNCVPASASNGGLQDQNQQQQLSSPQLVKDEDLMREKLAMEAALKMLGNIAYHRNANIDLVDCFNDLQGQYVRLKRWINNEVRAVRALAGRSFQRRGEGSGGSTSPPPTGILIVSSNPSDQSASVVGGGGSASSPQQTVTPPVPTTRNNNNNDDGASGSPDVSNSLIDVIDTTQQSTQQHHGGRSEPDVVTSGIDSTSEEGVFGGGRFGTCVSEQEGSGAKATTTVNSNPNPLSNNDEGLAAAANSSSSQQSKSILIDRIHNNSMSITAQRSLGVSSSTPHLGGTTGGGGGGVPVPQSLLKGWWDDMTTSSGNKHGSSVSLLSQGAVLATRMRPLAKLLRRLCPGSLEARVRAVHEEVDQSLVPYIYLRPQPPFREEDE